MNKEHIFPSSPKIRITKETLPPPIENKLQKFLPHIILKIAMDFITQVNDSKRCPKTLIYSSLACQVLEITLDIYHISLACKISWLSSLEVSWLITHYANDRVKVLIHIFTSGQFNSISFLRIPWENSFFGTVSQ